MTRKTIYSLITRLTAPAVLLFFSSNVQANLISNGGFETFTGAFNSSGYARLSTGNTTLTDWTIGGGSVDLLSPSFSDYGSNGHNNVVELSGNVWDFGFVEQTFSTIAGMSYNVTFDMNGSTYRGHNMSHKMQVSVGGISQNFTHNDLIHDTWDHNTLTFIANNTNTTLRFQDLNGDGFTGALLDNVVVTTVPLPASFWLFTTGLMLVGMFRRKLSYSNN